MTNYVFLTATAGSGMGSTIIVWIIMIVIFLIVTLSRDPKFFSNKRNIIGSCLGLGGGMILTSIMKFLPSGGSIILMLAISIAFIILGTKARSRATSNQPYHEAPQNTLSRVEKLTKLKDLLDSGAITQEEFDAKKKQLLGL